MNRESLRIILDDLDDLILKSRIENSIKAKLRKISDRMADEIVTKA